MYGHVPYSFLPYSFRYLEGTNAYGLITLYASTSGYITKATDVPAVQPFAPTLDVPLRYTRSILNGTGFSGSASLGFGEMILLNADGRYDALIGEYAIDGRDITLRMGGDTFNYSDFGTVFAGTATGWDVNQDQVIIRLRDFTYRLETAIQSNNYLGTGGLEGGLDIFGNPKPLCYGRCFNVTPVLVDAPNLIYQVHDGQINDILTVYDRGVPLTLGTGYTKNLTLGTFTLLNAPSDATRITADVYGDYTGSVLAENTSAIMKRILATRSTIDPLDIDNTSFTTLASANANTVGLYIIDPMLISEAFDTLTKTIGAWWGFSRAGLLQAKVFSGPASTSKMSFDVRQIISVERDTLPDFLNPPSWRQRIGYARNWTPDLSNNLAGAVSDSLRTFLAQDYRIAIATDTFIKTHHLLATDPEVEESLFTYVAGAQAEADRRLALYRAQHSLYRVRLKTQPFLLEIDDTVALFYPRWDLPNGRLGSIVSLEENATDNEVEMTVFV